MSTREFLGYPVSDYSSSELLCVVDDIVRSRKPHRVFVLNANKMYLMDKFARLNTIMRTCELVLPENAIYFGLKLLGQPLRARDQGGFPLARTLLMDGASNGYRFFLLGSTEEVVTKLVARWKAEFPGVNIVGWRNGYFSDQESADVAQQVADAKPDVLLVALGSPKQEFWISEHFHSMNVPVSLGVGGSFEVLAGLKKDAPKWTKYGLEWLYRSIQDPKKFKRYIVVNSFYCFEFVKHLIRL